MPEVATISNPDISSEAGATQGNPDNTPRIRALATPFKKAQLVTLEDGGLLIKGVPMLAAGEWTDSAVRTPLYYPEKTLSEYSGNWHDTTGWSRHLGGAPRDITDKVADAENIRFENGAITADVRVHGATQKSRDTIELVKRKLISFVSVEHGGNEKFNPETRRMEASTLDFYGFAFVNKGACKLCRINEQPPVEEKALEKEPEIMADFDKDAFRAELVKELSAIMKPAEPVKVEIPKELTEAVGALTDQVKTLSADVETMKNTPAEPKTSGAAFERELGEVETFVVFDRKNKIVRRG